MRQVVSRATATLCLLMMACGSGDEHAEADATGASDANGDVQGADTDAGVADDTEAPDAVVDSSADAVDVGPIDAVADAVDGDGDDGDVAADVDAIETTDDAETTSDADVVEPECDDDRPCVDDNACDGIASCESGVCVERDAPSAGSVCALDGEAGQDGICLAGACVESTCGDGFVDLLGGEQCDDGERVAGDGCSPDCRLECSALDAEPCNDGLDCTSDLCNEATGLCEFDALDVDEDGVDCIADCDDEDGFNFPGNAELCDGRDNDCDDAVDEDFTTLGDACDSPTDSDVCFDGEIVCLPDGAGVVCSDDPGSLIEVCDGADNDCDGSTDEGVSVSTWYPDCDEDGFAASGATAISSCSASAPVAAPACGGGWSDLAPSNVESADFNDANDGVNPEDSPRLTAIHSTVFSTCTSCHGTNGGMSLANNSGLRDRLLSASSALPSMPRVTPGNVERSYLWHKVNGTQRSVGGSGSQMGALGASELLTLRTWIEHGALP